MRSLKALLVLGLIVSLGACDAFEQRDRTFDDDPKLEFFPVSQVVDEPVTGDSTIAVEIQLIGEQRESDLPVSFAVDDSSTAVEGTHYSLPSTSSTIPANSSQTIVEVTVLDDTLDDAGDDRVLFLTLQGGEGVEPAENLKTHTLTIRGRDE